VHDRDTKRGRDVPGVDRRPPCGPVNESGRLRASDPDDEGLRRIDAHATNVFLRPRVAGAMRERVTRSLVGQRNRSCIRSEDGAVTTHAEANPDLTLSFVLRWLIVAAAACVVLSLLAGWRSGATRLALVVTSRHALLSAAITLALADVAVLVVVAA
jgi:hypothetical protein